MQIQMVPITPAKPLGDVTKLFAALTDAVRDQVAEGVRFMTYYPPYVSDYQRTGVLRHSWSPQFEFGGSNIVGKINSSSNIAPYNEEVQGENQSGIFKQIGWRNVSDLQNMIDKDFPKRVQDMVDGNFD